MCAAQRAAFLEAISPLCGHERLVDLGGDATERLARLSFADEDVEAAYVFDVLEDVPPAALDAVIAELGRVTRRALFVRIDRTRAAPLASLGREDWERRFFAAGWSKHPLSQRLTPYEQLERDASRLVLAFERLPREARVAYPLTWLAAERDLHMDMLREAGRRSDAHIARYCLAAEYVRDGDRILDAACGLGYGSAILSDSAPQASVTGLDLSESAIAYARAVFGRRRPRTAFQCADVMAIASYSEATLDVVASFETLEHIADPDRFVAEVTRTLTPGGRFICSVPNQWVDETGRDPNPFHLHVFDLDRVIRLLESHLRIERLLAQFAGGAMKHPAASRRWVAVPPGDEHDAEWWVIVATKPRGGEVSRARATADGTGADRADFLAAECRRHEREGESLRAQHVSLNRPVDRRRERMLARAVADPRGVVIFGAGEGGRHALARWRARGGRVAAFTDNRASLWGRVIEGVPVVPPEVLPSYSAGLVIIASSIGETEIVRQLESLGWCRDVDFTTL